MTKGSKFLNNPNIDRTLSWLLTVAGWLGGWCTGQDASRKIIAGTYCRDCSYGGVMRRYLFICRSSGIRLQ